MKDEDEDDWVKQIFLKKIKIKNNGIFVNIPNFWGEYRKWSSKKIKDCLYY